MPMTEYDEQNPLPTMFSLLIKQQRVSQQTNALIESLMSDITKARHQGEQVAVLVTRVENLEKCHTIFDQKRVEKSEDITAQLREMDAKREAIKDRLAQLDATYHHEIQLMRTEFMKECSQSCENLRARIENAVNPVELSIGELREKIAFQAGKYGGAVALVITIMMMLLQWIITHIGAGTVTTK